MKAFKRGEETKIFELYYNDIYYYILSYTLNTAESKDILQETFLKLYKNLGYLPNDDIQIKKWLLRIASNQSKNYLTEKEKLTRISKYLTFFKKYCKV